MSTSTVTPHSRTREMRVHESVRTALPMLILIYLIYLTVYGFTRAHYMGDTNVYTEAILNHEHGKASVDFRSSTSNPFWDFGHVLWRPLGWLCWLLSKPMTRLLMQNNNEQAEVLWTLLGINFVAALLCVTLFFGLAKRILGRSRPALLVTVALFSADAFLNYAHSGSPYGVGLACLVTGMWLSFRADSPRKSIFLAAGAGCTFAFAVLFWLPYVFVLPAAIAAPLFIDKNSWRWRFAGQTAVACAAVGLVAYGSAMTILGIRDLAALKDWIRYSGHGYLQVRGFRVVARVAFSIPRSFINMDRDGMWLKRYLVHDPYAPVGFKDLFRLSLWKLLLFYGAAAVVCIELLRAKQGRTWILATGCAVLPILFFVMFLFEAGGIEKYLPLYPFLLLACGYVFMAEHAKRSSKLLLILALAAMSVVNFKAMRKGRLEAVRASAVSRIRDFLPSLPPNSLVMAVNEQDNLAEFWLDFPLDPLHLQSQWQVYDMLEINTDRLTTWREDFAKQVLATWQRGGDIWLPQRVFRTKPRPDWNWVEGDDQRVSWADLPAFFSGFETGPAVGGDDGFVRLLPSPHNQSILVATAQKQRAAESGASVLPNCFCTLQERGCAA